MFFGIPVDTFPHASLNSSKGVIKAKELACCESVDEVKQYLQPQGVTDVYRIQAKKDGKTVQTHTYIVTFNTPNLPEKIKIFYEMI